MIFLVRFFIQGKNEHIDKNWKQKNTYSSYAAHLTIRLRRREESIKKRIKRI